VATYTINDLEKLTGIKAHTLRIWEQRYSIISPQRSANNVRYFTDEDLKRLLNISLLNKRGLKISKIAKLSEKEIEQLSQNTDLPHPDENDDVRLDALVMSMMELDEFKFEKIIKVHTQAAGFSVTMLELINPFLEKMGMLWFSGSITPAHEHFVSAVIRRKLIAAIDAVEPSHKESAARFVLFLPEDCHQDLLLLYMHYLIRNHNFRVSYLGANLTYHDVQSVCKVIKPTYILTLLGEMPPNKSPECYIKRLASNFPEATIFYSGIYANSPIYANAILFNDINDISNILDKL
jgi:DNA-binding transcriptional MerR regulator